MAAAGPRRNAGAARCDTGGCRLSGLVDVMSTPGATDGAGGMAPCG